MSRLPPRATKDVFDFYVDPQPKIPQPSSQELANLPLEMNMAADLYASIKFDGGVAANGMLDFYDARVALEGFQRSLALATHLAINGEIIVQAPSLKGAKIYALPPEDGSWKMTAVVVSGLFAAGTASQETPLGHLISSVYDAAIHATLGVELDYRKSLRQLVEEQDSNIRESQIESLAEKCQTAFVNMHRPIVTDQAENASVQKVVRSHMVPLGPTLNMGTFDRAREERVSIDERELEGAVASYNINTKKGRIFLLEEERPIPFELSEGASDRKSKRLLMKSLSENVDGQNLSACSVIVGVQSVTGRSGVLRRVVITSVKAN